MNQTHIPILFVALLIVLFLFWLSPEGKTLARTNTLKRGGSLLSVVQVTLAPVLFFIASWWISCYKGISSAANQFDAYMAYIKVFADTQMNAEATKILAQDVDVTRKIELLANLTNIPFPGMSETFLIAINICATLLTMLLFVTSVKATSADTTKLQTDYYYDDVKKKQEEFQGLFNLRKPRASFLLNLFLIVVCIAACIFLIPSSSFKLLVGIFCFFICVLISTSDYALNYILAPKPFVYSLWIIGTGLTCIYGLDLYNDYRTNLEIGGMILEQNLVLFKGELLMKLEEYNALISQGAALTAEQLTKYNSVMTQEAISNALAQKEDQLRYFNNTRYLTQVAITIVMILLDLVPISLVFANSHELQGLISTNVAIPNDPAPNMGQQTKRPTEKTAEEEDLLKQIWKSRTTEETPKNPQENKTLKQEETDIFDDIEI